MILSAFVLPELTGCRNPCKSLSCEYGGFCHDGQCLCAKWYAGDNCELQFNRNYGGVYFGKYTYEAAGVARSLDSLVLVMDSIIPNRMHTNHGFYFDFESDSSVVIPKQTVNVENDTLEFEGVGKYRLNWVALEYNTTYVSFGNFQRKVKFEGERVEL